MQVSIFVCQRKSCCVENCCLAQALDIRFDFLLRRHYILCLFQCQSDSALTRTYWSSRGTAGRNSRFKLFLLLILGAFSFVLSAILNSQAGYRCTLVPRLPFPVPRSPFPVPAISNIPGEMEESQLKSWFKWWNSRRGFIFRVFALLGPRMNQVESILGGWA